MMRLKGDFMTSSDLLTNKYKKSGRVAFFCFPTFQLGGLLTEQWRLGTTKEEKEMFL